jgi:hypothetical protein
MATKVTNAQIEALRIEADNAGDIAMSMICVRALGDDLADAEPGTDGADARELTVADARAKCALAIANAEAQS